MVGILIGIKTKNIELMLDEEKNIDEEVFDDHEADIIGDDDVDIGEEEIEELGGEEEFSALSFSGARGLDE